MAGEPWESLRTPFLLLLPFRFDFYKNMGYGYGTRLDEYTIRTSGLPVLREGSVKPLCAGYGYIAYTRFDGHAAVAVACNNTERPMQLDLPLRDIGIPDGTPILARFSTTPQGSETLWDFARDHFIMPNVENGQIRNE